MYNKNFAKIYNQEWNGFSETLADIVLKISNNFNSLLDLGCGTGNFLKKLENHFNKTVGIDISKDMINIAKQNCLKTEFILGSVTDFNLNQKFDLITCNFDMINHLSTISDWEKMFYLAYKHLNKNGLFLFDINTIYKFNNLDCKATSYENESFKFKAKNTKIDKNHLRMNIQVFNKQGEKIAFVDEIESFYDETTILKSLNKAGFNNVVFSDMNLNPVDNFEKNRLFILCKKQ